MHTVSPGEEVVKVTGSRLIDQIIASDARRRKETNEQIYKQLGLIYRKNKEHYGVFHRELYMRSNMCYILRTDPLPFHS